MIIEVEIEHRSYHHLVTVAPHADGSILLKPIQENQQNAIIRFFLQKDSERSFLKEYPIDLTQYSEQKPRIEVSGIIVKKNLKLTISIENTTLLTDSISLRSYLKRSFRVSLITAGVLLVLLILFFGIRFTYSSFKSLSTTSADLKEIKAQKSETVTVKESSGVLPDKPATGSSEIESAPAKAKKPPGVNESRNGKAGGPVVRKEKISIRNTIYFYPNSSQISQEAQNKLSGILSLLISRPDLKVTLSGHCALWGTKAGRMKLSKERAMVIKRYLETNGWNPQNPPRIRWYGARKPVTTNPEKKDLNRRVEIEITSE